MEELPDDIEPPELARLAVEKHVLEAATINGPLSPAGILRISAPVFVTLRIDGVDLRGCIGTLSACQLNVSQEIIVNAIRAASADPRFKPVVWQELPRLNYGVDVLHPLEPARGIEDLDPSVYGVSIETLDGSLRGVLLPRISGIETALEQWTLVHRKAGITIGTPVKTERFKVSRFGKE
jgi:AMMECR1 domain-containing protein